MQRATREGVSLIVEGVHIQPGVIDNWAQVEGALVVPVMLAVLKPKALRRRIAGRSRESAAASRATLSGLFRLYLETAILSAVRSGSGRGTHYYQR